MTRPVIYIVYDTMKGDARFSLVHRSLMSAVCKYANSDGTRCTASNKTLSEDLCLSVRTIERAFTRLSDLGMVTRQRRKWKSAVTTVVVQENQDPTPESVQGDQDPTPESVQGDQDPTLVTPRPDAGDAKTRHQCRTTVLMTDPMTGQDINMSDSPRSSESDSRPDESDPSHFDEFYEKYPRREKRPRAEKVWDHLAGADRQAAIDALPRHLEKWESEQTPKKFIPLPSTWLNDRSWEDDIKVGVTEMERDLEEIRRAENWMLEGSYRKDDHSRFGGGDGSKPHPGWDDYIDRAADHNPRCSIECFEESPEFKITAEPAPQRRSIKERTNGKILSIREVKHPRKFRPIPEAHRKPRRRVKFAFGQKLIEGEPCAKNSNPN